jgi:PAS domain S-box-containing protein
LENASELFTKDWDQRQLTQQVCTALVESNVFTRVWIFRDEGAKKIPRFSIFAAEASACQDHKKSAPDGLPKCIELIQRNAIAECSHANCNVDCSLSSHHELHRIYFAPIGRFGILGVEFFQQLDAQESLTAKPLLKMFASGLLTALKHTDRIQTLRILEAQLENSKHAYQRLVDNLGDGYAAYTTSQAGQFVFVSRGFRELFGLSAENVLGQTWSNLGIRFEADSSDSPDEPLDVPLTSFRSRTFSCTLPNGFRRIFEITQSAINDNSSLSAYEGVCLDITERTRASEFVALRLKLHEFATDHTLNELLRKTLDEVERLTGSRVSFYHFLENDQTTLSLQAWSTRTALEYCTVELENVHYPISSAGVWADCIRERRVIVHNDYTSLPNRRGLPAGHASLTRELVVPVFRNDRIVAILGVGNKPTLYTESDIETLNYVAHVAWMIVEQKRTLEEISRINEILTSFVKHSPVYAFIKDVTESESRVLVASDNYRDMIGISGSEMIGKTMSDLFPPGFAEKMTADDQAVVAKAEVLTLDEDFNGRNYTSIKFPIRIGNKTFLAGYTIDITDRKRAEHERQELHARLAQSDRLASMGMVAAGVAHEINNPLSYVLYNLESLVEDIPILSEQFQQTNEAFIRCCINTDSSPASDGRSLVPNPSFFEDIVSRLKEALSGASRIKTIARSLGSFSRVESVRLQSVDVRNTLEQSIMMAFNEIRFRAHLVKDYSQTPPVLATDGKLVQVFLNLLVNAAHAIDEGHVNENEIRIRTWFESHHVCIEIRDTGKGIPNENRSKLFQPFFTTKGVGVGTGLGLAMCKKIVSDLGGTIDFESKLGVGTSFFVRLPCVPSDWTATHDRTTNNAAETPPLGGRILVIDDEEGIRNAIVHMLSRTHSILTAASGEEAKRILQTDLNFDVILCDLMMPKLSGMELHAWLAQKDSNAAKRVIFVTGGAFTPGASEYLAKVGNLRIEKPFETDDFVRTVNNSVVEHRSTHHS